MIADFNVFHIKFTVVKNLTNKNTKLVVGLISVAGNTKMLNEVSIVRENTEESLGITNIDSQKHDTKIPSIKRPHQEQRRQATSIANIMHAPIAFSDALNIEAKDAYARGLKAKKARAWQRQKSLSLSKQARANLDEAA